MSQKVTERKLSFNFQIDYQILTNEERKFGRDNGRLLSNKAGLFPNKAGLLVFGNIKVKQPICEYSLKDNEKVSEYQNFFLPLHHPN